MEKRICDQIRCPYYKRESSQMIYCEGVSEGTVLHLAFDRRGKLGQYRRENCAGRWYHCRIAKLLNRKWGYEIG